MTDADGSATMPTPVDYGSDRRTYPFAPEPASVVLPDGDVDARWTVRTVCRRVRHQFGEEDPDPLTGAETGVEIDPETPHIEAVLRRDPYPESLTATVETHKLHFVTADICRSWLERAGEQ